jgi:peroxiredoxin
MRRLFVHADLSPGKQLLDLELPDHNGISRRLSQVAEGDPLVVVFFRGWWCPKEQTFFRGLVRLQDEIEVAYTRIVSVSVDTVPELAAFRAGLGARWTFLSDSERAWLPRLDLLETTDTVHHPYVPTTFTAFPDLTIHRVYNGYWYWGRPTAEDLRQDLRSVTRALRSDWEVPS